MGKDILFIGPIAHQGGPAIKNRLLVKYLDQTSSLEIWNTYDRSWKTRVGAVRAILSARQKQVIVAVSKKGRMLLYPFLLLKKKMSGIHYACVVIGGKAVESLKNPLCAQALKNADLVTVETKSLVQQFEKEFNLSNVYWMPNYKEIPEVSTIPESANRFRGPVLRFLFLSSMRDAKGVPTLLKAFQDVLKSGYEAKLDFYGPVKNDLSPGLLEEIENTENVQYCGFAENEQVLSIMGEYDVFVFPTEYSGEGFPAVLVEAQAAGLPIIASDMNYNPEIIKQDRNGWIFEHGNHQQLVDRIRYCLDHRDELCKISQNNMNDATEYDAKNVIASFIAELRKIGWTI